METNVIATTIGARDRALRNTSLARDYNIGMDVDALAQRYNLKPSTVRQYIVRLRKTGLVTRRPGRTYPEKQERNARIVAGHKLGESIFDLSVRFSLSEAQIKNILSDAQVREETGLDVDPLIYVAVRLSTARQAAAGIQGSMLVVQSALSQAVMFQEATAA